MFSCCSQPPQSVIESTHREADMGDRVFGLLDDRRVRNLDYIFNACATVVGVALIAFAIAMVLPTYQALGWTMQLAPYYVSLMGVGIAGGLLTLLSVKWMLESCRKSRQYDAIVAQAQSQRPI
ncbi:MAG: hypothetical protein S4CHLAM2_03100 [Chlamydiales bacterium]|nr:hypothetical protein [Chlamydiales bacterium]